MTQMTFKKSMMAVLAVALTACTAIETEQNPSEQAPLSFTGVIDRTLTRTSVASDGAVTWNAGDLVSINGVEFAASLNPDNAAEAEFVKVSSEDADPEATFCAVYPASLYDSETGAMILPEVQQYSAVGANAPMYAQGDTRLLSFSNIAALLRITLKDAGEEPAKVRVVRVTADKGLCGAFTIGAATSQDGPFVASLENDDQKTVYLDCGAEGVALSASGTDFYVAVPAATYGKLTLLVTTTDGKSWLASTKAESITVSANNIYPMNFTPEFVPAPDGCVDLGLSVYWAYCNLNADSEEKDGEFYTWADPEPGYASSKWRVNYEWIKYNETDGLTTIVPEDDAATANLGAPWRIPTKPEWEEIMDQKLMTWTWGDDGYTITSKILGFEGNSIYLPAAGYKYGSTQRGWCMYWSSTLCVEVEEFFGEVMDVNVNNAYSIFASSTSMEMRTTERQCGYPVRPVIARQ